MSDAPMPTPPREPEIEFMGKLARCALRIIRAAFFGAGTYAVVFGCQQLFGSEAAASLPPTQAHWDRGVVWIALGVPLMLPNRWLFTQSRARIALIVGFAALWFAPVWFANDSPYGFILRMFATLVAFLTMLVWRTLWRLTQPDNPAG